MLNYKNRYQRARTSGLFARKGIDIDQANSLSAEQAIQLQAEIETAVKELEAKKKLKTELKQHPLLLMTIKFKIGFRQKQTARTFSYPK